MAGIFNMIFKDDGQYSKMFGEFAQAFNSEMRILDKAAPTVGVTSVKYLKDYDGKMYYECSLAREEYIASDTPCALVADTKIESFSVQLVDTEGKKAIICSSEELPEGEAKMTLHIGEKIVIQELAKALVEYKKEKCPLGEKIFKLDVDKVYEYDEKELFIPAETDEKSTEAVIMALENDVTFIDAAGKNDKKQQVVLKAQILYNLYKQKRNVLYLGADNSIVDETLTKLWEIYQADHPKRISIPFIRTGYTASDSVPEELLPGYHARLKKPTTFRRMDELEEQLLAEDIAEMENMLENVEKAKKTIQDNMKVISGMQYISEKTKGQLDEYKEENKIKKKVLLSSDYQIDKEIRMSRADIKIQAAKDAIDESRSYIEMVEESKKFFDKEMRLLEMRESFVQMKRKSVKNASIVGTVMTMSYLDEDVRSREYDTVVIDGASEMWVPEIWQAAYLAGKSIIVIGDITASGNKPRSRGKNAEKWLGTSIFRINGIMQDAKKGKVPVNMFRM